MEIALHKIRPNPKQPRKTFEEERIAELAMSIKDGTLLNPITVEKDAEEDIYNIIAGERRWRAYCWLKKNFPQDPRWKKIPSRIPDPSQADNYDPEIAAIIENMHRESVPPLEEAEYILKLVEKFGSIAKTAKRLNKSEDRLQILVSLVTTATPEIKAAVASGALSISQYKAIRRIHDPRIENKTLKKVLDGGFKNSNDIDKSVVFAKQHIDRAPEVSVALLSEKKVSIDHAKLLVDVEDAEVRNGLLKNTIRGNWDAERLHHEILIAKNPIHLKKKEEEEKAISATDYILQLAKEASEFTDKLDPDVIPYLTKSQRQFVTDQFRRLASELADFRYRLSESQKTSPLRLVGGKGNGK